MLFLLHLNAGGGPAVFVGGEGNDKFFGSGANGRIFGGNGNDVIPGSGGKDFLDGGAGNDIIFGSLRNDTILGGDGKDVIFGFGGNDVLDGGNGDDRLFGGRSNDILKGGAGNDILIGGPGTDTLDGGSGTNILIESTPSWIRQFLVDLGANGPDPKTDIWWLSRTRWISNRPATGREHNKVKPKLIFIAIFYLIFTNFSFSEEVTSRPFVDKKVAGLIIGEDSIEKVIKLYGRGVNLKTFHGETLCYYDAGEQTYFIVSTHVGIVETITLTEEFNDKKLNQCKKRTIKIMPLATSRGVKIGDSPQKVTRIYGEPHKKETKDEMLIFEYHTDYKEDPQVSLFYDAYLYFRENRLVKFAIHDGE